MPTVLVIDDDDIFRNTVCRTLESDGLKTISSQDSLLGLALARRNPPDIVICDYDLDKQTGLEALSALRASPRICDVPFILMTGHGDDQLQRRSMDQGADDFLKKPFTPGTLLSAVHARLRKHGIEQRRTEETKERLLSILDATPDFLGMATTDGRFVEINRAGLALFGIDPTEGLRGLTMQDIRPDDLNPVTTRKALDAACRTGVWRGEGIFRTRDGQELAVSQVMVAHPTTTGQVEFISTTARNISESRKRDESLRLLERALETVASGIIITDAVRPDFPILYSNPAFERMTGYTRAELAGKNCRLLQGPETSLEARQLIRDCLERREKCHVVLKNYRKDGTPFWNELSLTPLVDEKGRLTHYIGMQHDITAAKEAKDRLRRSEELFRVITENAVDLIAIVDRQGRRIYNSPSYTAILGLAPDELHGTSGFAQIHPEDQPSVMKMAEESIATGQGGVIEYRMRHKDGRWLTFESHGAIIRNPDGEMDGLLVVARDITERKNAELERTIMDLQLRQAQKLESIGQLAAGIAHEINTPTQYIGDNTRFLTDAFRDLSELRAQFRILEQAAREQGFQPQLVAQLEQTMKRIDLDYLEREIPSALQQSIEGIERVAKIVLAMKEFSHPGTEEKSPVNINRAIESTVTVARNTWKYVADLDLQLDPKLPAIPCLPGEFNQVILNLVVNAAHAIADVVGENSGLKGRITISTAMVGGNAEIRIADTGGGIPDQIRDRIFDPFFTTKPVGKGTGQGLAITRSVIVDKHGGTIAFDTRIGEGTTFILTLPVSHGLEARPCR
jgi:two-component system, NtrC family, sensor kinase